MNNAELYSKKNQLQIRDAEEILEIFNEISAISEKSVKLLDIGSGCGEVLAKVIIKKLNCKVVEAIGLDISKEMVEYSRKKYENEVLRFYCFDIFGDSGAKYINSFDVITSMYCLHWVNDLKNAFKKINQLLKPGGYFMCSILKTHAIFDAYSKAVEHEKFAVYMHDLDKIYPPLHFDADPVKTVGTFLKDLGLEIQILENKQDVFDYGSRSNYKSSMKAINPFVKRMSEELQDDFMDFLVNVSKREPEKISAVKSFNIPYQILYVIARKR